MKQGKLGLIWRPARSGGGIVGGGIHSDLFPRSIALPNLFVAWREFVRHKKKRADVLAFAADVEERIFSLHEQLKSGLYRHGGYKTFLVRDPKLRRIHKASVRDRLLHHAVHRVLYPHFEKQFIHDSYASRKGKGAHAAVKRFREFAWRLSRNRTRTVYVLKADIRRFFDSIDHEILLSRLEDNLPCEPRLLSLLRAIVESFHTQEGKGIPLGNLTSQLFSNVYLSPLDQFVKRRLRVKNYIRYADDILIASPDKDYLAEALQRIREFLANELRLTIHPEKTRVRTWASGTDILGFISYPSKTVLRHKTRGRMLRRLERAKSREDFWTQESALYSRMKFER